MSKTAGDIMTRNIITVNDDTSINNLVGIFIENKISCAPVINNEKQLIGIVTKNDILSYFMEVDLHISINHSLHDILESNLEHSEIDNSPEAEILVRDIMTANPLTVDENTKVNSLAKIMLDRGIHRLIVENDGVTVGIISTRNILNHVAGIEYNG
ncbi:CBS domain-containing protein [Candidatus Latescibacterota bacterium]